MGCAASQEELVEINYIVMKKPNPPVRNTAN